MRPIRIIPKKDYPFDITFAYQDENRFAVRLLNKIEKDNSNNGLKVHPFSDLNTTRVISSRYMDQCEQIVISINVEMAITTLPQNVFLIEPILVGRRSIRQLQILYL